MREIQNDKIKEIIRKLEDRKKEIEIELSKNHTLGHFDFCFGLFKIREREKEIDIYCNNHTKFSSGFIEEKFEKNIGVWNIYLYTKHSVDNLLCFEYCKIFNDILQPSDRIGLIFDKKC